MLSDRLKHVDFTGRVYWTLGTRPAIWQPDQTLGRFGGLLARFAASTEAAPCHLGDHQKEKTPPRGEPKRGAQQGISLVRNGG